jgi:hypothetical protein
VDKAAPELLCLARRGFTATLPVTTSVLKIWLAFSGWRSNDRKSLSLLITEVDARR